MWLSHWNIFHGLRTETIVGNYRLASRRVKNHWLRCSLGTLTSLLIQKLLRPFAAASFLLTIPLFSFCAIPIFLSTFLFRFP
jgi:hypothetical protein